MHLAMGSHSTGNVVVSYVCLQLSIKLLTLVTISPLADLTAPKPYPLVLRGRVFSGCRNRFD